MFLKQSLVNDEIATYFMLVSLTMILSRLCQQILMVDGNGLLHPRGKCCFLLVSMDFPFVLSIVVKKNFSVVM